MPDPRNWTTPAGFMLFWVIGAAMVGAVGTGGYYWGAGSTTQATLQSRLTVDEQANAAAIVAARTDAATSIAAARSDAASALAIFEAATTQRFAQDESDTKAAVQTMNDIGNRLTRIEAQLDLIVKNVTTTPVTRR